MNKTSTLPFDMALMEAIKDMVFMVSVGKDSVLRYEFFNQAVFERTHLTQNDTGKTFQETHNQITANLLNQQYGKALETMEGMVYEDSYTSPSGKSYYSKTALTPLFDKNGTCTHIIGVVKDMTNERLAALASEEAWERLKESQARYRSLYENNTDAVFSLDLDGRILAGNEAVETVTGFSSVDLIGVKFSDHIVQNDHELLSDHIQRASMGVFHDFRTKFLGKSGQPVGVLIKFAPVEVKGEIVGVYTVMKDMRELDKMASQYVESENRFRIIAENAHDVIVLMDHEGETQYVSPSSKKVYGLDPSEHMGKSPFHNVHPEDIPQVKKAFSMAIQEAETYLLEVRLKHKTKGWVWAEVQGTPIFDEQQQLVQMMTITQDITLHKEHESRLQHYAYHDSLTGLPNRRFLKNRILEEINQAQEKDEVLAVILLDIDHFKDINDQFGHEVGDEVIEEFGKRLSQTIGEQDVAARLGGDEFVLLLPGIKTEDQAADMAQKIRAALGMPWQISGGPTEVTASMGIALTPLAEATVSSILKNADLAMYESKESGRGAYRIHCL